MQGRVLVVDDEKAMVLALRGVLTKEGYQVETASSGKEALERIETGNFHVVITNNGDQAIDGAYARGADPDQDADIYGDYQTINSIPAANWALAMA